MPRASSKKKQEIEEEESDEDEEEENTESHKTSIQISTTVRDRLWRLKFRKTYDEFLNDLCEMYEKKLLE